MKTLHLESERCSRKARNQKNRETTNVYMPKAKEYAQKRGEKSKGGQQTERRDRKTRQGKEERVLREIRNVELGRKRWILIVKKAVCVRRRREIRWTRMRTLLCPKRAYTVGTLMSARMKAWALLCLSFVKLPQQVACSAGSPAPFLNYRSPFLSFSLASLQLLPEANAASFRESYENPAKTLDVELENRNFGERSIAFGNPFAIHFKLIDVTEFRN